jgi:hypothetical protein
MPLELARWHYDRARLADIARQPAEAEAQIVMAERLDPRFPLYSMRLALLRARTAAGMSSAASLARQSAEWGRAVPSLWLVAGVLGYSTQQSWSGAALEKACFLDPFNPFPPFYGLLASRADPEAASRGAQALLNEPRLAAAVYWERHPERLPEALGIVRAWPEVDIGWKQSFFAAVSPLEGRNGTTQKVWLDIDTDPSQSLSLTAFRRLPWTTAWGLVDVDKPVWDAIRTPPAAASQGTSRRFIHAAPCRRSALTWQSLLTP